MQSKRDMAAKALKAYRLRHERTLQEMADETELHLSTISKIENGKTRPSELTIARLEKKLPGLFDTAA